MLTSHLSRFLQCSRGGLSASFPGLLQFVHDLQRPSLLCVSPAQRAPPLECASPVLSWVLKSSEALRAARRMLITHLEVVLQCNCNAASSPKSRAIEFSICMMGSFISRAAVLPTHPVAVRVKLCYRAQLIIPEALRCMQASGELHVSAQYQQLCQLWHLRDGK